MARAGQDELVEDWPRALAGETLQETGPLRMIGLTTDIADADAVRPGVLSFASAYGLESEVPRLERMCGLRVDCESGNRDMAGWGRPRDEFLFERVRSAQRGRLGHGKLAA